MLYVALEDKGLSIKFIALRLGVSERTVRDWRRGAYTIPQDGFEVLLELAGVLQESIVSQVVDDWWYTNDAGVKGGHAYMSKYTSLGTTESRRRGGSRSYEKRKNDTGDIYAKKTIILPPKSPELAEFVGIMIGDGSVGQYQISITLDSRTDKDYAEYVANLAFELFGIMPRVRIRETLHCIVIEISAANLVEFLVAMGLPQGDKLRHGLSVPGWIQDNAELSLLCARGMFDTDGSIYQEVHFRNGRRYAYPRLSFVSASPTLLREFQAILTSQGIDSVIRGGRAVKIERFTDIERYFRIVGSSNAKHLRRYSMFGGVA